ncbi:hypothetical protein Tco_1076696 [Tanacetum coccineum]
MARSGTDLKMTKLKAKCTKVEEHLIAKEIEKLVEGTENVENVKADSSTLSQDDTQNDPNTRLKPRSNKESLELEITIEVYSSVRNYMSGHILHLQQDDLPIWLVLKYKFERLYVSDTPCRPSAIRPRDQDDHHDDAHPEGGIVQRSPSMSVNQEQLDDFDFLTDSYATDDDELPSKKVSQELVDEMSQIVDESRLRKVKGSSRPEKIVMSLHKFFADIFPDDDIEERTFRWIVTRRANGSIVSITESDYKNLNKNDIEDMYQLIVNRKLGVESYQQKVNLTAPTVTFLGIKKYKVFFIISKPVYGIIYKNSKKEKRVMRHQEIHKFCDATLKRVFKGLKSYNNNVKHGYVTPSLSNEDVEFLQLFKEEIEEPLKHRDQIRRWEIYVNGRPLGSRRERPE